MMYFLKPDISGSTASDARSVRLLGSLGGLSRRLPSVEDALKDDEFKKSQSDYEALRTVTPVLDAALEHQIRTEIDRYEADERIPPAWRWREQAAPWMFGTREPRWCTNKPERLKAVLWVMESLPHASSDREAMNQLACVLDRVEALAQQRAIFRQRPAGMDIDPKPMRLTQPLPETVNGMPLLVSYGIRHVILFNRAGAMQVQCLPLQPGAVDYASRRLMDGVVLLDKPDAIGQTLWSDENPRTGA